MKKISTYLLLSMILITSGAYTHLLKASEATLLPFEKVCETTVFELSGGMPEGGVYYINGSEAVVFDAQMVGVGTHEIRYEVEIAEGILSSAYQSITVLKNVCVEITFEPVKCFNGSDGRITVTADEACGAVKAISIKDITNGVVIEDESKNIAEAIFSRLSPGVYLITVEGANGCILTETITLLNPPLPVAVITPSDDLEFCQGGSVKLTASDATAYKWSNGETEQTITADQPGIFTVTVYDANNCPNTSEPVEVVVNPNPSLEVPKDFSVCAGEEITLSAVYEHGTISWDNGVTDGVAFVINESATFTATVTSDKGCGSVSKSVTVKVDPLPTLEVPVDFAVCAGSEITLSATYNHGTVSWDNGLTDGKAFVINQTTTFTATVTSAFGCNPVSKSVTVTVNPLPTLDVPANFSVCAGQEIMLDATYANGNLSWDKGVTNGVAFIIHETTTFTATVVSDSGCDPVSKSVTVTVNPLPTVEVPAAFEVCAGTEITLNATYAHGTVSWNNGITDGVAFVINETTTFTATVTSAFGCAPVSKSVTVTVNPLPTLDVPAAFEVCAGTEITLSATYANGTIGWNNGVTDGVAFVINETTTFTATATSLYGCDPVSKSVTVTVNPLPTLEVPADFAVCKGSDISLGATYAFGSVSWDKGITDGVAFTINETTTFTATVTSLFGCAPVSKSVTVTVNELPAVEILAWGPLEFCMGENVDLTATEAASYLWSTNETTQTITVATAGNYSVTITDANGCTNTSASVEVKVNELPELTFAPFTICPDEAPFVLDNATPAGGIYSGAGVDNGMFDASVAGVGTHLITYTYADPATGCINSIDANITVSTPLIIVETVTDLEVYGDGSGAINVKVAGGTPPYQYLWDTGENTAKIENLQAGDYFVTVFDFNGCFTSKTITVGHNSTLIDLGITIEVNIQTPDPKEVDELKFAVVVTNHSDVETATGVVVKNLLPEPFPFISRLDDGTSGSYFPESGLWSIGTILPGEYKLLVYRTEMLLTEEETKSLQSAVNTAEILPFDQIDINLANNIASIVVSVGESSGGDDNGIESDGSMASQLALRNHRRLVESAQVAREERVEKLPAFDHVSMLTGTLKTATLDGQPSSGIGLLLPETGPAKTKAFISTPSDLLGITNASEIFAVDYLEASNARRAAILAISTEGNSVYEHTKVICDRLMGAQLRDIDMIEIAGQPFIVSKLVHPNGYIDYSVSFIAQKKGGSFVIDNRWHNEDYEVTQSGDILNFQVWSINPHFTRELVEEIIQTMKQSGDVRFLNAESAPSIPQVFVQNGRYTNGGLLLNLVNKAGADQITIYGNKSLYENGPREPLRMTIDIPTSETVEVFIPTGYLFDAGFSVSNNKDKAADVLYYSDGTWMFDYDTENAMVNHFSTTAETATVNEIDYKVERDASFSGRVRTWATMFRTLSPRGTPVDMRSFDQIVFTAQGEGTVEVMLAKAGINQWSDQYRKTITLSSKPKEYRINFSDLATKEGERGFSANDVVSVIFNPIGNGAQVSNFDVNVQNLHFANSLFVVTPSVIFYPAFPNPFRNHTTIELMIKEDTHVKVEVLNILGQTVAILANEEMGIGTHKVNWHPGYDKTGIYMIRATTGEETYTTKVIFEK